MPATGRLTVRVVSLNPWIKESNMHLTRIVTTGLTAVALSTALFIAGPAQAESRTFPYGTIGSVKYDGGIRPAKPPEKPKPKMQQSQVYLLGPPEPRGTTRIKV